MPNRPPSLRTARAMSRALSAARPLPRSIGICRIPRMNAAITRPLTPPPAKYSALAQNVISRGATTGRNSESHAERWLLARIAGPVDGMCSRPEVHGRHRPRITGATVWRPTVYSVDTLPKISHGTGDGGGDLDLDHESRQEQPAHLDGRARRRQRVGRHREQATAYGRVGGQVVEVGHEGTDVHDVGEAGAVRVEDAGDDLEDVLALRADVTGRHDPAGLVDGHLPGEHEQGSPGQIQPGHVREPVGEGCRYPRRVVESHRGTLIAAPARRPPVPPRLRRPPPRTRRRR